MDYSNLDTQLQNVITATFKNVESNIESYQGGQFWWLEKRRFIDVAVKVTTSTVTVTINSATVTAAAAAFTTTWIGKVIVVSGHDRPYHIKSVESTTSLTLESKYRGASGSGKSYEIADAVIMLPWDCREIMRIRYSNNAWMKVKERRDFEDENSNPTSVDDPEFIVLWEKSKSAFYSTGSVAVTNGSATVTGSSTGFVAANVIAGMFFKKAGDSDVYEIDTVDSATQLTLKDNYIGTTSSGSAYQVEPVPVKRILIYPYNETADQLELVYWKRIKHLMNDNDTSEMPDDEALIWGVVVAMEGIAPDMNVPQNNAGSLYMQGLNRIAVRKKQASQEQDRNFHLDEDYVAPYRGFVSSALR